MEETAGIPPGAFFSIEELLVLFPRLKKGEAGLSSAERRVLHRIEKLVYEHLSVQEIENRLGESLE